MAEKRLKYAINSMKKFFCKEPLFISMKIDKKVNIVNADDNLINVEFVSLGRTLLINLSG